MSAHDTTSEKKAAVLQVLRGGSHQGAMDKSAAGALWTGAEDALTVVKRAILLLAVGLRLTIRYVLLETCRLGTGLAERNAFLITVRSE